MQRLACSVRSGTLLEMLALLGLLSLLRDAVGKLQ
jgi:hypothetical protein